MASVVCLSAEPGRPRWEISPSVSLSSSSAFSSGPSTPGFQGFRVMAYSAHPVQVSRLGVFGRNVGSSVDSYRYASLLRPTVPLVACPPPSLISRRGPYAMSTTHRSPYDVRTWCVFCRPAWPAVPLDPVANLTKPMSLVETLLSRANTLSSTFLESSSLTAAIVSSFLRPGGGGRWFHLCR